MCARTPTNSLNESPIFCCWSLTEYKVKSLEQSVWCEEFKSSDSPCSRWQTTQHGERRPWDLMNTPIYFSIHHPEAEKMPKKVNLGLFTDVFPLKVSHLFHTQTLSNWIVNLWWRLIIRPSSEVLMRSYFSWMTSPQITSGDSGLWVWTCFQSISSSCKRN